MSFGGGLFFTNRGRALQAKAQTGIQLNFTRIGVGDGELGGQAIADLTALVHEVKSINLNKFKTLPGGKAVVGGVLSNQGLATSFYWRELGLFATDPDLGEILYCYGNAGALAEYIPAGGGAEILEKQVDIVSLIGNAANVSATIEQSLVFETPEGAQAKADAAQAAAQLYAEGLVEDLAGPGNTKTVKQIDDIVTSHLADDMPHKAVDTTVTPNKTYRYGVGI
ncbi:MAG: phage tail protein, partial [Peptococcaceae bacterium]|nr:phage tail protein [Peptococcaceae bacterium]